MSTRAEDFDKELMHESVKAYQPRKPWQGWMWLVPAILWAMLLWIALR